MIDLRVHPDADVSDEYREAWERGQREADELWEQMKNGYLPRPQSLRQELLLTEQNQRLY